MSASLGQRLAQWLEERAGLGPIWRAVFLRRMPAGLGWAQTLGSATLFVFGLQVVTGMFLALYYSPSPDHAYDSIQYITTEVTFGSIVRGLHHWGASAMVVLVAAHLLRVFYMGAYKYPHEVTWVAGLMLLLLTLAFGFTGYLLPWDEKAYWATTVGTNIMGLVPFVGGFILRAVRGGAEVGAVTLARFFTAHALILPWLTAGVVGVHLYLVIRNGISAPPDADAERKEGALRQGPGRGQRWPRDPEVHEAYLRRQQALKEQGKPFFPDVLIKDALVVLVLLLMLLGLTVWRGVPTEGSADPTNTVYVPRPEWYFMFLFEFLKYVPGQLEGPAAIGLPGLAVLALLLLPFVDRSPARHPRLRPYGTVLMSLALAAVATLSVRAFRTTPPAISQRPGEPLTAVQQAGRTLFRRSCAGCHTVDGSGSAPGPDLSGVAQARGSAWVHSYIEQPQSLQASATMPGFVPAISHQEVEMITSYLMSLHGPPAPTPSPFQEFRVTAYQFGFEPDVIVVTAGLPVRLIVSSQDVDHGLAIPGLEVVAQISAGRTSVIEFTPTQPGDYAFECAVQCGTGHARMRGVIQVR